MKNKLDPFAARLEEWRAEGKTLAEMVKALKEDGCVTSPSSISEFLSRLEQARMEKEFFAQIATGGRMNKELDAAYQENPAPDIDALMRMSKTLIMSLNVHGVANPKLLSLANNMQATMLEYLSGQTKAKFKERELALKEAAFQITCCERFLEWWKDEKARAIADSSATNATKIAALRQTYFADVDALQKSGQVKLPE